MYNDARTCQRQNKYLTLDICHLDTTFMWATSEDPWIMWATSEDPWIMWATSEDPWIMWATSEDPWIMWATSEDPWIFVEGKRGMRTKVWVKLHWSVLSISMLRNLGRWGQVNLWPIPRTVTIFRHICHIDIKVFLRFRARNSDLKFVTPL